MVMKALLACHHENFVQYQNYLRDCLDEKPVVYLSGCVEDAIKEYEADTDIELVMLDIGFPETQEDEYDEARGSGLDLVEHLAEQESRPRILLFSHRFPEVDTLERIQRARYQRYKGHITFLLVNELKPRALNQMIERVILGREPISDRLPILDVHMRIDSARKDLQAVFKERSDQIWTEFGELNLGCNSDQLSELIKQSEAFDKQHMNFTSPSDWMTMYTGLGRQFHSFLFGSEVGQRLNALRAPGGKKVQDLKICFHMAPEYFSGMFEAIIPDWNAQFTLAEAAIVRRLYRANVADGELGLRQLEQINILVVDASQTGGRPVKSLVHTEFDDWLEEQRRCAKDENTRPPTFASLEHAAEEVAMFKRLQKAAETDKQWQVEPPESGTKPIPLNAPVGRVEVLQWDGQETTKAFRQRISEAIADGAKSGEGWHVVHYIGHSVCTDPGNLNPSSYMILPGPRRNEPVPAVGFVDGLNTADTRFVYLSSCESASSDVAKSAINNEIKSALGFRWNLRDDSAFEFSKLFYRALFSSRLTLDEAVRDARSALLFNDDVADQTWASAVFVCQSERWHAGHGEAFKPAPPLLPESDKDLQNEPIGLG